VRGDDGRLITHNPPVEILHREQRMRSRTMSHERRAFLAIAGLGVLASAIPAHTAESTAAEQANVQLVRDFCASWSTRDLAQILPRLADDCVYRMSETVPPVIGHSGVTERLESWMPSSDLGIEFKILDAFAAGPIVMNHRVDSFKSTTRPLTWEGVGVFFIKDGKIKEWSDYTIRTSR
jgi:limonene-1,2-epoxide hydrolase